MLVEGCIHSKNFLYSNELFMPPSLSVISLTVSRSLSIIIFSTCVSSRIDDCYVYMIHPYRKQLFTLFGVTTSRHALLFDKCFAFDLS